MANPIDENARTRIVDSDSPQALAAGTRLGRYRIDAVLGQGGFGITYRATDTSLDRPVAIKEFLPLDVAIRIDGSTVVPRTRKDGADYEWGLQRFLDEAKTLARHEAVPHMVRVYDFIEANGTAYMVMALVTGENLSAVLRRRGTLPEAELKAIALPLLDGLQHLHQAGLVHRDIKPANIILSASGAPTLIDFGAARQALGRLSRSITSIVTPGYAPFEQYGSAGEQGPWTDIYALAATLYHGLAGKPPPDSVDRIRRDPMVPALQAGGGRYTEGFLLAVDAALKVDETERPQSAEQWRALLIGGSQSIAAVVPLQTPSPSATQPISRPPSHPPSQPPPSQPPTASIEPPPPPSILATPPAARGSRKMLIAAGAAVLLIGGGAAVALTIGGSPQTAKPDQTSVQLAEAEKKRAAELERKLAEEAESRKKLEAQVAETEARRKAEEEARRKAAEEARVKAEAEAREKAEAENRRRIEEDTRKKVEAEFKAKAEEDAKKRQAEEETKRKAEEVKKKAEDEARKKAEDEARKKAEDEAKKKAEQQKVAAPQVAAATPPARQQAAAAPPADPVAYVAQHWNVMRPQVEAAFRRRGPITDPSAGGTMQFDQVLSYRVLQVTSTDISVMVNARFVRIGGGSGLFAGAQADFAETATFKNDASNFSLVSLQAAVARAPAAQPTAAAGSLDPASYVAQHWPVLKANAEAFLRKKGQILNPHAGWSGQFTALNDKYVLQSLTPTAISLEVTIVVTGQIPGGANIIPATAVFQNQPSQFPVVRID